MRRKRINDSSSSTNEIIHAWFVEPVLVGFGKKMRGDLRLTENNNILSAVLFQGNQLMIYYFPLTNMLASISIPPPARQSTGFSNCLVSFIPSDIQYELRNITKASIEFSSDREMNLIVETTGRSDYQLIYSLTAKKWTLEPLDKKKFNNSPGASITNSV